MIKTEILPFTTSWWDYFLEKTDHMTETSVIKDCIDKEETTYLKKLITNIIYRLSQLRTNHYGYRVFIEGRKLDENEMNMIYDHPPLHDESVEDWCTRIFQDKEFGIIINSGERFNDELAGILAQKSLPLFDKVGFPVEGINFTIFIGNYKNTPIGIHQDMPGENVLHYHLGPGNKRMYTWDESTFKELEKKYNHKEIEKLLPYGEEFTFEEGDLYFMPQGEYHVGQQESISTALTFWFYNHSKKRIIEKLHTLLIEQYTEDRDELLSPDRSPIENTDNIHNILSICNAPDAMMKLSYTDMLAEAYKDLRYSISSNSGYRTSPVFKNEDTEIDKGNIIILNKPFKILYKESFDHEKLHIFIRGTKLEIGNFECIKKLIDEINIGEPLSVKHLLTFKDEGWDDEIGLYILSLIFKNQGIVITK